MPHLAPQRVANASAGFRALFLTAFAGAEPIHPRLAMQTQSQGSEETYDFLTGIPGMRRMAGESVLRNISEAGFTIKNEEWESTVPVKRKIIERNSTGSLRPVFSEMGRVARMHPDELVAELLNKGFTGGSKDYTGKNFFDTDKKIDPGSNKSAKFTNRVTTVLGTDGVALTAAKTSLRTREDAEGNNLNLGTKWLLVVPPALEGVALTLRDSKEIGVNTNIHRDSFDVLVINQLSSDTAWFLVEDGREIKPLIVQTEVAPEFVSSTAPDAEHVLLRKEFIYQTYGRWNAGYAFPQLAYGSTGTGE